jgi:hypothetical protein
MPSHQEEKDSREHADHENANNPAGLKHLKDVVLQRGCLSKCMEGVKTSYNTNSAEIA